MRRTFSSAISFSSSAANETITRYFLNKPAYTVHPFADTFTIRKFQVSFRKQTQSQPALSDLICMSLLRSLLCLRIFTISRPISKRASFAECFTILQRLKVTAVLDVYLNAFAWISHLFVKLGPIGWLCWGLAKAKPTF